MTLEEMIKSDKVLLSVEDVCQVLESQPVTVRSSAKAGTLGFPVCRLGNRVKIPRLPFLRFLGVDV